MIIHDVEEILVHFMCRVVYIYYNMYYHQDMTISDNIMFLKNYKQQTVKI